tara:strand:+ start:8581 stop:14397 length:5817 start_codon:yes stop_codon:yes gene_type:complete
MATCFNRNLPAYQTLLGKYDSPMFVDSVVNGWQKVNRSELIPTIPQVEDYLKDQKTFESLDKQNLKQSILTNLGVKGKGLISALGGSYYINNTNKEVRAIKGDRQTLERNKNTVERLLDWWQVTPEAVTITKTDNSYRLDINANLLNMQDVITETSDVTHLQDILQHLTRLFPDVQIQVLSQKDAKKLYDALPQFTSEFQKPVDFKDVKSFYVDGQAVLVEGRVTSETAIEEVLHPFVNALYADKSELFRRLKTESERSFPKLAQEIAGAYTKTKGFDNIDRDKELVTQAMARHFKREYEQNPTESFRSKIREFMRWLMDVFSDLSKWVVGKDLSLAPGMIDNANNLTSLSKILNTGDLKFSVDRAIREDRKVRFSLTPRFKKIYNKIKGKATSKKQITRLDDLYNVSIKSEKPIDDFTVSMTKKKNHPLVILNKKTHKYISVENVTDPFTSVTTKIGGLSSKSYSIKKGDTVSSIAKDLGTTVKKIKELNPPSDNLNTLTKANGQAIKEIYVPQEDFQTNMDIGNDFDNIVSAIVLDEGIDSVDLKVVSKEVAEDFYTRMKKDLAILTRNGGILIPQVVVSDKFNQIAGTIDLLYMDEDGSLEIIDIKTSKDALNTIVNGKLKYEQAYYPVSYGSIFYDPNKSHDDQQKFTKEQMQALQVNSYAQILRNQDYDVDSTFTFHVHTPVTGKGKNQKYTQKFIIEGLRSQVETADVLIGDPANNNFASEMMVKDMSDPTAGNKLFTLDKQTGENEIEIDESEIDAVAENVTSKMMSTESVLEQITDFKVAMSTRKENYQRVKNQIVYFKDGKDVVQEIDRTLAIIDAGVEDGNVIPLFEEIVKQSTQELDDFIEYVNNPDSYLQDPNYISKVLNYSKMVNTYESLSEVEKVKGLTKAQLQLIAELRERIYTINGKRDGLGNIIEGKEGLINTAIDNFAKQFIKDNSKRDFTQEDLEDILRWGTDIGMIEYQTGTLATSSDTILALMDKVFKRKRQEVLDRVEERNSEVRRLASRIEKLSPGRKANFDFMIVLDENGVPTGNYVKKIGRKYVEMKQERTDKLKNSDGDPLEYVVKQKLTPEEIAYNKKLYKDRQEYRSFMQGERIIDGKIEEGKYHRYTEEFKKERSKFMFFDGQQWQKRDRVPLNEYLEFRTKYYNPSSFFVPINDQDGFTGYLKPRRQGWFPKSEYLEVREQSSSDSGSINFLDPKYQKIMNPTNALQEAQKEFYEMYIKYFEQDLLKKLPMRVVQQMHGRLPLIKDTQFQQLKNAPNMMSELWAKVKGVPRGIYDFFATKTQKSRVVLTDEYGNFTSTLPIFYTGKIQTEQDLQQISDKIKVKEDEIIKANGDPKTTQLAIEKLKQQLEDLKGKRRRMQNRPEATELSRDLADSLIRFSAMAENYEIMSGVEDTLSSLIKVLERRTYDPATGDDLKTFKDGVMEKAGLKGSSGLETPLIVRRAKKWMKMVFYDDDQKTENVFEKISRGLISYTSLTYVGLNPWGNLNNYAIGRINNLVETAGARWYDRKAAARATKEFNQRMIPDFMKRMGGRTFLNDAMGVSPGQYEKYKPGSKYEALVELFRMMDDKADIREQNKTAGKESPLRKAMSWGYMLQDAAEYNVQTKVGMSILMSTKIFKSGDPDGSKSAISLFDAYEYNQETGKLSLQEGYDTVIDFQTGKQQKMSDKARYDIRQYIREVNIHIHGNYAYEDRMVLQSSALGQLAAQFHKWIAPAVKARYRSEYFDENLGWIEGRYRTFWNFMTYTAKNMTDIRTAAKDWKDLQGEKAEMKIKNLHRVAGELMLFMMTVMLRQMFAAMWDDADEDKKGTMKRFQNAFMYQMDRQRRELLQFVNPRDAFMLMKSPISSVRMMKEMSEALMTGVQTPFIIGSYKLRGEGDVELDKRIYYQRGAKKGDLKLYKEFYDAFPGLYALNRWMSYDNVKNFWVGD